MEIDDAVATPVTAPLRPHNQIERALAHKRPRGVSKNASASKSQQARPTPQFTWKTQTRGLTPEQAAVYTNVGDMRARARGADAAGSPLNDSDTAADGMDTAAEHASEAPADAQDQEAAGEEGAEEAGTAAEQRRKHRKTEAAGEQQQLHQLPPGWEDKDGGVRRPVAEIVSNTKGRRKGESPHIRMRIQPKQQEVFLKDYAQRWRRYKEPTAGHAPPDSKYLKPFTRQLPRTHARAPRRHNSHAHDQPHTVRARAQTMPSQSTTSRRCATMRTAETSPTSRT
jgi:hypothetical protein